jgi:hypothetical protein
MELQHWWAVLPAFLIGAAAAWAAATWWFGRKLKGASAGLERVEKARHFAAQQAAQARKQIETLQHEMGELRQRLGSRGRSPSAFSESRPPPPEPPAAPDGFADTQVLLPRR